MSEVRERSAARRLQRGGRHRADPAPDFGRSFTALGSLAYEGATVSASVIDVASRHPLVAIDDHVALPTASVGKVLLLIEVSARLTERGAESFAIVDKCPRDAVGGSGLWQNLQVPALPVVDLAALVGAASDNLATNLLLARVGLDAVRERAESIGLRRTALLDLVRDERGPDDAPQFSIGSAAELSWLLSALARGEIVDPATSARVLDWLSLNADLSMVASAFGLDPLAHRTTDHSLLLVNKTGTDPGVRSEVGVLRGAHAALAYAVTVLFTDRDLATRLRVLEAMRTVGTDILEYVA